MQPSIQQRIREFVVQSFLYGDGATLADNDSFLDAGVVDSTGVLELVGFLESAFTIAIDDDELVPANLDSVESAARFVERKLGEPRVAG